VRIFVRTRTHIAHIFVVYGARIRTPIFAPARAPALFFYLKIEKKNAKNIFLGFFSAPQK
jgi:hypothetical protein